MSQIIYTFVNNHRRSHFTRIKKYFSVDFSKEIDFVMLANSMGAKGVRVTRTEQIEKALDEAFSCDLEVPFVIDFVVEKDERVYPMVIGKSLEEMIG